MTTASLPDYDTLKLCLEGAVLHVELHRPDKRNAMNGQMVAELRDLFRLLSDRKEFRALVLRGANGHFCAGGDISGMISPDMDADQARAAAREFNRGFGHLVSEANRIPQVLICLLEGAVLGGGFGLACASDIAIADENTQFALPETGLGILPAQIAPFVVLRIGLTQARWLALTGERIKGAEALRLGLIHYVADSKDAMRDQLDTVLKRVQRCAPGANARTKALMLDVAARVDLESLLDGAADQFAETIQSKEGLEGTQAFLQKRLPYWAGDSGA